MKKLISLLLALVMCLSLAACGGGKDSGSSSGGSSSSGTSAPAASTPAPAPAPEPEPEAAPAEDDYGEYTIFDEIDIYESLTPDDLAGTTWEFAGGYTEGRDLTEEEAVELLEMYGGTLQIEFVDTQNANMVQGGGKMPGNYELANEVLLGLAFELQGTEYLYGAVFTLIDDDAVMVLCAADDPSLAFYMVPV